MPKNLEIPVVNGGRLLTQPAVSLETVGGNDFTVVKNLYRDKDQLIRQQGWTKFIPNTSGTVADEYTFGSTTTGTGIAVTTAYYFDVLGLYNYRSGGIRTGEYHSDPISPYGWLPGPGTITAYHPYDSNHNGMIDVGDLSAAITAWGIWKNNYPQLLTELVRGDGTRVVIGASQDFIKYYDTVTSTWITIGGDYASPTEALLWQYVALSNVAIFNNGYDLPKTWEIGDVAVVPLYELREAGIAKVGRIASYNGFLFAGDITEIKANHLPLWMNGYGSYTSTSNSAKNADFTVTNLNFRVRFQVTTGAGTITATLPTLGVGDYGFYFLIEKVDAGAGTVVTLPVLTDEAIVLSANTDLALIYWNGTTWVSKKFALGAIPATDPYGVVPADICQYYPDEQAWSELGAPKNLAPFVTGYVGAAGTSVVLPFKPFNWTANRTRLALIGAGSGGGVLGGQTAYPNGILATAFAAFNPALPGIVTTIEVTTDASITYPRLIGVTRWTDITTFVGKQRMGNGNKITCMLELNGLLINYQTSGIFITRYTANAAAPFALRSKYVGNAVPMFGDCVAAVRNQFHIYAALNGSFIQFDGLTDPVVHDQTEQAKDLFFTGMVLTAQPRAFDNPMTQQIWFVTPRKVMAYRYQQGSEGVNEIDAIIGAAGMCRRPGATVDWFVLAVNNLVYQYGMINGAATTWLRDAVPVTAQLTSGLNSFKVQQREKTLLSFTPIQASPSPDMAMTVQIRGTYNPSGALTDLLSPIETLPTPAGDNFVLTAFQANYFSDEIILVDTRDLDFRISGRLFEFDVVGGLTVTRSGNV